MSKEHFSSEEVVLVTEILKKKLEIDFADLFDAYKNNPVLIELKDNKKVTEADLIKDILDDGEFQLGSLGKFEDKVVEGTKTLAGSLGFKFE